MAREESFLISKIHIFCRNSTDKKYTMRREDWRKAKTSEAKTNSIVLIKQGRTEFCTSVQPYARIFSDEKISRKLFTWFLWRWKQAHDVSSRGTAYLWDKILQVTPKYQGVWDTLKCELGKKEMWTPNVVLFSELRGIESYEWFRRLWRYVSQRRMPGETEKHEQKIFHPKQCWFQMKKRRWKRNERMS